MKNRSLNITTLCGCFTLIALAIFTSLFASAIPLQARGTKLQSHASRPGTLPMGTPILESPDRMTFATFDETRSPDIPRYPGVNDSAGSWTTTGSLNTTRDSHTATLLPNGMVLVVGGFGPVRASAELYDPASGMWTPTGSLNTARAQQTATLLSNGMVLVAGGFDSNINVSASAELYDPASGTWTPTGNLNTARTSHTATLLPDGMVLVAGGFGVSGELASAELYDPASGTWMPTGSLNAARRFHTATLLPSGMVLVAAGTGISGTLASAELYNPANGSWTNISSLNIGRQEHTATLLPNGMVMVAGGGPASASGSAELYDSASGNWMLTGSLNIGREQHTATLLPTGMVLVAGGFGPGIGILASAELYDPASGTWTTTGSLNTARRFHTATLLPHGMVLAVGGLDSAGGDLASAELYQALAPLQLFFVVSRKTHGSAGAFDIDLPLTGTPGVECRSGGATGDYSLVATFNNNVVSGNATFDSGIGSIAGPPVFSGHTMTVNLSGVANVQTIIVTLRNVTDEFSQTLPDTAIPMSVVIGDSNGNGSVNASDVSQTKSRIGQALLFSNFRSDVNASGTINATDIAIIKSNVGTGGP